MRDDMVEAEKWWRKAAEQGEPEGMRGVGVRAYHRGDLAEAEKWLTRAADMGDREATRYLAVVRSKRRAGEARQEPEEETLTKEAILARLMEGDTDLAERLFRRPAMEGNAEAAYNLGAFYQQAGNLERAHPLWLLAAELGQSVPSGRHRRGRRLPGLRSRVSGRLRAAL
ncbi:tetratricopeptide repeat protein [Streptomyces sp. NPDC096132]|uniref:tetratricopeptide repeat protein n=1 Tax=Streptomyces sp. NPDC096132 TaxID=3366075 RepID=UPI00381A9A4B